MIKAGLFSSSSSLVPVPDILNLTATQALSALSAAELLVGTTSTTTSGANSSNNGKIASQSVASATLVERYSSINYVTYFYEAAPPPPPPTTWYCTQRSASVGVSNYITNVDETGSVCGSYATSCSTSGYPSAPSIPACPPPPPPPPPSVTCSPAEVFGVSASQCPSRYAQRYLCSDGSSYSVCV